MSTGLATPFGTVKLVMLSWRGGMSAFVCWLRRDSVRNGSPLTGTSVDREARLQSVLDDARSRVNSAEVKLVQAGALALDGPHNAAELTWRVLLAQTIEQTRSLDRAIKLLAHSREDVVELQR
jgi:hypothetical protein